MLAFTGVRPGMTVLDVSAGGGYTTELLARAVAPGGRVYAQTPRRRRRALPIGCRSRRRQTSSPSCSRSRARRRPSSPPAVSTS